MGTQTTKSSSSSGPPSSRSRSSSSSTITDLGYSSNKSENGCGSECGSSSSPTHSPLAAAAIMAVLSSSKLASTSPIPNPLEEGEETLTKPLLSTSTSLVIEKKSSSSETDAPSSTKRNYWVERSFDTICFYYVRYRLWNVTSIQYAVPFIPIVPVPVPMRKDGRHYYPKKMEEIRGSRFLPST